MPGMTNGPHDIGDVVTCTVTITVNGTPTDPTAITFQYKKPGTAVVTGLSPTKDSTGVYHYTLPTIDTAGTWYYRFVSTGTAAGAEEYNFSVKTLLTQ